MANKNNDRNNRISIKSTRGNTEQPNTSKIKTQRTKKKTKIQKAKNTNYNQSKTTREQTNKTKQTKKATIYSIEKARNENYNITRQRTTRQVQSSSRSSEKTKVRARTKIKNSRNTALYANIFSIILFFSIIVYFSVFFIKFFSSTPVNYAQIELGTIDSPKSATGIIIRDEQVYKSTQDGVISFNIANNEKVKAGTTIATIKSAEVLEEMEQELEEINKAILSLQESRAELSWFFEDVEKINTQIQSVVDDNIYGLVEGDISKLYEISNTIQKNIDLRSQILLSETTGSLSDLAIKRKEQEEKINENSTTVKSQQSGILSYYVDGLEEVLTVENMLSLTKEQTNMDSSSETITLQVFQDEPIFKMVNSNEWYIATYLDSSYVEGWEEGQTRSIYVKDSLESKELETKVYYIDKSAKETFMILKLTKNMLDYIDTRSITFELDKVKVGLKINNNAIVEENLLKIPINFISEDGTITKQTTNGTINLNLDLSYENDTLEFAYTPIQLGLINVGDTILNPNDLSQTYTIDEILTSKGVYVINTGITKFVKINLENSVSNEQYTILDQNLNTRLTIYDNIILDVKNIEKEQSIYN